MTGIGLSGDIRCPRWAARSGQSEQTAVSVNKRRFDNHRGLPEVRDGCVMAWLCLKQSIGRPQFVDLRWQYVTRPAVLARPS